MRHGRDRNRIEGDEKKALSHPLRLHILALHTEKTVSSLEAEDVAAGLEALGLKVTNLGQVAYHVVRLTEAELLASAG
jgi:hypothetical protein